MFAFGQNLQTGILLRRYKRFLADIRLDDGQQIVAHCPNSGSMATCCEPGSPVLVRKSSDPKRKLAWTWVMIQMHGGWIGVDTQIPNAAVSWFVQQQRIGPLQGYSQLRREVPYGVEKKSRIDLLLEGHAEHPQKPCYVEIKNTTMRVGSDAAFPDAVTLRGQKHLRELKTLAMAGTRAVMFFFVGRQDCARFRPADEIDPVYGQLLREAAQAGVEILAYSMRFDAAGVELVTALPVLLEAGIVEEAPVQKKE